MPEEEYRQRRKIEERPLTPPQTNVPSELFEILKKSILDYHHGFKPYRKGIQGCG